VPSGEKESWTGFGAKDPPSPDLAGGVMIVRSGRPSRAITTIGPVPWTAASVPSSACVGECQPPPVVSCTLREPSGVADQTLPWSMYTIESALATAGTASAARPAARRIFGSVMRRSLHGPHSPLLDGTLP
jgi:hypothetical protein